MATPCYCTSLRIATRRVTAIYDEALAPIGIGVVQFSFLRAVERRVVVGLSDLGDLLDLDRSTVGRNARVLERLGFVVLGRGKDDQRETTIGLTQSGRQALQEGVPLWEAVQKDMQSRLGNAEAHQLLELLSGF